MKLHDISQAVRVGMPVWPGDQPFETDWTLRIARGDSCNASALRLSVHTGTHIDAPYHFMDSAAGADSVPLDHCIGPARVVCVRGCPIITERELEPLDWRGVERVLFRTRLERDADVDLPFSELVPFSPEAARFLAACPLKLVGTDAPSVDAFDSKDLPCHKIFGRHNVTILEGVRLDSITPGDYELICLPLKLDGLDGSPVRAVLRSLV